MRIFVDTADLNEIDEWDEHPWVSGFTTNPTLMRQADGQPNMQGRAMAWAKRAVSLTDKPISIDGPRDVWELGTNVYRKVVEYDFKHGPLNHTAICHPRQLWGSYAHRDIISVFAGRIMDTGRDPLPVIEAAQATGALVLWASVREPFNIVQADLAGCDIVTVPPAILRKYLAWNGKPLEVVADETIAQFEADREGLW
jgi:transaldolase